MQLTGPNVFGPPASREQAIALLREAVELGVDHIDTAQYYGPAIVNELMKEALHPYPPNLVLVSKVGAARGPRGEIFAADQPEQLRPCCSGGASKTTSSLSTSRRWPSSTSPSVDPRGPMHSSTISSKPCR
jgi:aryl-alcohol dehydrogenase-like predicted oxidoreductase